MPDVLNVVVVPDERDPTDGYGPVEGAPVQHVTASVAECVEDKGGAAVLGGLLKELLVKADVQRRVVTAIPWPPEGIEHFSMAKAFRVRGASADDAGEVAGDDEEYEEIASIDIAADGTISYALGDGVDGGALLVMLFNEKGEFCSTALACRVEAGGKTHPFRIEDAGLTTVPNDLAKMVDEQVRNGVIRRNKAGFENELAPMYGICSFAYEGSPCYFVGYSKKMNQTVARACRVRRIVGCDDPDVVRAVTGLCDVGLSRYGQPTVWPIVSKYLDEAARAELLSRGERLT